MVESTLALWGESAKTAGQAWLRSAWALVGLFVASAILGWVNGILVASLPFIGGIIASFLQAGLAGAYLYLLRIVIYETRVVRPDDLMASAGALLSEVISILFIFYVGSLLLSVVPLVAIVVVPLAALVFNPAPEMVYQERSQSLELLGDAARFMRSNWPEWLFPQLVLIAAFAVLFAVPLGIGGGLTGALTAVELLGPFFGFTDAGSSLWPVAMLGPLGIGYAVVMMALIHYAMLFRGQLYKRLRNSSRRSRAWQQRTR